MNSPLQIQFVITSLEVGGAETLLLNLIKRLNRDYFAPQVVCLKEGGPMASAFAHEAPLHCNMLRNKWDWRVASRLKKLFVDQGTQVVITVGAGDKMFWGRLAARLAGVKVICSALHSTGWPDGIGRLNRWLTPITDGFIAVARPHAEHLVAHERFPQERVFVIPNGVDTQRFQPVSVLRKKIRDELQLGGDSRLVGIVAALRPEKNHRQFIDAAYEIHRQLPNTQFLIIGDGPERATIESYTLSRGLGRVVRMLGNRNDTQRLLPALDVFCLTSLNEANPVSIMEALACGVPVVAPDVGSISETVIPEQTGILTRPGDAAETADAVIRLLGNPILAHSLGGAGRAHIQSQWSLDTMVGGYEHLMRSLYIRKVPEAASWLTLPCQAGSSLDQTLPLPDVGPIFPALGAVDAFTLQSDVSQTP
jgi:glycosyltransferase involved in cell wall biosynthesis